MMRRRLPAVLCVAAVVVASCGGSAARPADAPHARLRWAPPALHDPITVRLGTGYTDTVLDPTRDYVVELPHADKLGGVTLEGGHDVVVIGGHVTVPGGAPPGKDEDRLRTGLYVKDATGTVHVEGVSFDALPGVQWDAIDVAAPQATVQLENLRVDGVHGSFAGFHADVVQPWGGVRLLRIDHLTASSDYQGLTLPIDLGPIGSAVVSHVDLHGLSSSARDTAHLLWLTTGSHTCRAYPVALDHVYIQPPSHHPLGETVWPQRGRPRACGARVVRRGALGWPRLPVHGMVHSGVPPGGPYVPQGVAGVDYRSPGYVGR